MTVDWAKFFTNWQIDAASLVGLTVELASAVAYSYGVARLRRSGRRWPAGRVVSFGLGLLSLAVVLQSGFAGYDDELLWVHMTQHLVLMMLVAPLLALGAPVRLGLAAGTPSARRIIASILHEPSMQLVTGTLGAVLLSLDYYGSMATYVLTPLYRLSELNQGFHEFIHVYFLLCGLMFWVPLLGQDPVRWRPSFKLKISLVSLGAPVYAAIAAIMLREGHFISPDHTLHDIRNGAWAMLVGGLALTCAGDVLLIWRERQRRTAATQRHVSRRSSAQALTDLRGGGQETVPAPSQDDAE